MILGISGKIQSGKDTIGNIIQYFTSTRTYGRTCEEYITAKDNQYYKGYSNWEIRKFADKLKDIVCILIGCTRDQLEDNEFKNKQLGEEWTIYYFLGAYRGIDSYGKLISPIFTSLNEAQTYKDINKQFSSSLSESILTKRILTPRLLLQIIGTDCGRNIIHPNIWINSLFADYKYSYENNEFYFNKDIYSVSEEDELQNPMEYPNWIITDVRFPNEVEAIKSRGGIIIRVNRPDFEYVSIGEERVKLNTEFGIHESETALDRYNDWNYVINNDSTIENLIKKVKQILIIENICNLKQ